MPEPAQSLISHQSWLRRLARRLVSSPSAADDLVQETCIAVLRRPPPADQMRPWLRGVMRRLALHQVRGERRRARREDSFRYMSPWASEPDRLLAYGVDRDRLLELVATLPEPFRSTVVQRFLEGMSCAEIARAQGVPTGTVRWRQSRALELLRGRLESRPERRRPRGFWLPLTIGAHRVASHLLPASWRGKAAWTALAAVAIALGLYLAGGGDGRPAAGAAAVAARPLLRFSAADEGAEPSPTAGRADGAASSGRSGAASSGAALAVAGEDEPSIDEWRRWFEAVREEFELALYDCEIDRGVRRCRRAATARHLIGRGTCLLLGRSLDAIDIGRAGRVRSAHTRRFLAAAAHVNRSLESWLGCALATDPDRTDIEAPWIDAAAGVPVEPGGADDDLRCESSRDEDGRECTTCTGPGGTATACGPVDCRSTTEADGGNSGETCIACTLVDGDQVMMCDSAGL
jgi:RNA polymerase sigma factor (sigma-70 family)